LPAIRLWQNVSFWTSTDVFLLEFLRLYANADAPLLDSLLFACPSTGRNRRPCDGLFVTPPTLFRGHLPNLSELRLLSATLPWDARGYFGRLFALDVRNLPGVGWPTVPAFIGALVASTALRHLVLGGAGVVVDHASVIHAFTLPSLETLTIVYSERAMGFITLLAACSFPVLKEFNAYDFDRVAWAAILHLAFFDQLERCSISGSLSSVVHIPGLLRCLVHVLNLDVSGTGDFYFHELSRSSRMLCPLLMNLTVGHLDITSLLDYVVFRSRDNSYRLDRVDLFHSLASPISPSQHNILLQIASFVGLLVTYPDVL
jgi:hypothetical protein